MDSDARQYDGTERDERLQDPAQGPEAPSRSVRYGAVLVGLPVFLLLLSAFVVQPFRIPSSSMAPTLQTGDRVLVNKLAYRFGNHPGRGDVVVFDGTGSFVTEGEAGNPVAGLLRGAGAAVGVVKPSETDYVKRVIGVGGDRVRCCDERGRIEVNGEPLHESYLHPADGASSVPFDIEVQQGRLWVLGDHRSRSSDSRDHLGEPGGGTVPVDRVTGSADWIVWPGGRLGAPGGGEAGGHD